MKLLTGKLKVALFTTVSLFCAAVFGFLVTHTFKIYTPVETKTVTVETARVVAADLAIRHKKGTTGMTFTGSQGIILACIAGFLIFTVLLFIYRLLRKTPPIGKTRFGFFIEHDFDRNEIPIRRSVYDYENTHDYPINIPLDPAEEKTHPNWPDAEKPGDSSP